MRIINDLDKLFTGYTSTKRSLLRDGVLVAIKHALKRLWIGNLSRTGVIGNGFSLHPEFGI